MKRVLFLPSDHGGGKGHVARCLALGQKLKKIGFTVAIVLEGKHYQEGVNAGLETFLFDTRMERFQKYQTTKPFKPAVSLKTRIYKRPVYVEFNSLAFQVPRDGYISEKIVRIRINKLRKIAEIFSPDVIVGDMHFSAFILSKMLSIPAIQITRFIVHPNHGQVLWWRNDLPDFIAPDALKPFQEYIQKYLGDNISKIEDLLQGDRYFVPAIKEIEPVTDGDSTVFIGPLNRKVSHYNEVPFFAKFKNHPKIYISIGGGAGRSNETKFFRKIIEIFDKTIYKVLVSTGRTVKASKFEGLSDNISFVDWVDGIAAINQCDLVVFHGGYGTMMEVINAGKPSIVIPSHCEQEGNGRRLEKLSIGHTITMHDGNTKALDFSWPYGTYRMFASFDFRLEKERVLSSVEELLDQQPNNNLVNIRSKTQDLLLETNYKKILNF